MKTINVILLLLFGAVACAQSVQAASVAVVNTAWDEGYLYMAVRVESANVRGSHSIPNASVAGDDTVSFYLSSKDKLGVNTCVLEISAASGSQLRVGTAQGMLEPKQAFTFKYGVTVDGTLNQEDDVDKGYLIEAAIPWQLVGLSKAAGAKLRFNVIVKDSDGKQLSLASAVESEADMIDPSKWSTLELAKATPAYKADRNRLISQTYSTKAPMIDGVMKPEEWLERHVVAFSADGVLPVIPAEPPVPTEPAIPVEPSVPAEPILPVQPSAPAQAALSTTPKRVFATYYYWFQAAADRGFPVENIVDSTGKSLLKDMPIGGIGPWLTYDSVQWHLDQLQQASDTGVDILLPVYRGDKASRSGYANRGLDNIIVALDQMSDNRRHVPALGLFLDTYAVRAAYGSKPNLADEEVQSALYGMIKEFFDRVPVQYRAMVQTPTSGTGHVVFLGSSSNFSDFNSEVISYCNRRFMQDFGKQLIWAVDEGYVGKLTGYDAVVSIGAGLKSNINTTAAVKVASVGPGYDNSAVAQPELVQVRGRGNFANDFNTAIAANPDWIVLDSWNNYSEASEIAPSVERGSVDMEVAKSAIQRFKNPGDYDASVDWLDIPNVIQPKEFNVARIRVRNAGKQAWTARDKVSVGYRWYRDGKYYADSGIKVPLSKSLQPGESLTMNFGIAPVDESKSSLPEGAAELRIELFRASDNKWFGELGGSALVLPVRIAPAPEYSMSIVQSDIPQVLAVNEPYKAKIYIRNEGSRTWPAESGRLTGKLYRSSSYTHDSTKVFEPVGVADIDVKLPYDCTASMIAEIDLNIKFSSDSASALPESQPQNLYLVFDVMTNDTSVSAASSQTHMVPISIYSYDSRAFMADAQVPDSVKSGQKFQVKVALRNDSPRTWTGKNASVALHWYDASGNAVQEAGTIKLKKNILAGKFTVVAGEIVAPAVPGSYNLVVDMLVDGKVASKSPVRHAGDQLIKRVEVTGK